MLENGSWNLDGVLNECEALEFVDKAMGVMKTTIA
jgi:hypothetical protein